jgi:hypothetical protein
MANRQRNEKRWLLQRGMARQRGFQKSSTCEILHLRKPEWPFHVVAFQTSGLTLSGGRSNFFLLFFPVLKRLLEPPGIFEDRRRSLFHFS